jgi:UDP-glucose 4-epimerase
MLKIAITGVAGMIGSHLSQILINKGYQLIGIDNLKVGSVDNIKDIISDENFKFFSFDIRDKALLKKNIQDCDIIVHLAAIKKVIESQSSFETLDVNVKTTQNILEISKEIGAKVIFASTSDVYGISENIPFREDQNLIIGDSKAKRWAYAVSKLYCEHLCISYQKDLNVDLVILRYFGGFSEKSSFSWSGGHVPIFINQILNNFPVTVHGDGKQTRSMGHADDLAYGTYLAIKNIEKCSGEIINIGNTEEFSVIDTVYLIGSVLRKDPKEIKIEFIPEKEVFGTYKDLRRRVPDISKAKKLLNYEPKVPFKEAIERVAATISKKN